MGLKLWFKSLAARIILIYGIISVAWLLCTNPLIARLTDDPATLLSWAAMRGAMLTVMGSVVIYGVLHRAERSLQQQLTLLQAIVDGTTDAVFVKDLLGRYVLVNQSAATLLQRSAAEVLGRDDHQLVPESASLLQASDRSVLSQQRPVTLEEILHDKNGTPQTFSSTKYPWTNPEGTAIGVIGVSRDITQYKQLEHEYQHLLQELQQQNRYLEALNVVTANAISSLSLTELLNTLLRRVVNVSLAEAGVIMLQTAPSSGDQPLAPTSFTVAAVVGHSLVQSNVAQTIVLEFATAIAASPHALHIEDLHTDPRLADCWQQIQQTIDPADCPPTHSLLGVPLKREQQLVGVLLVEWHQTHPYDEQEVRLLEITAERCAAAVLKAQLFEQSQQLQEQLQLQIDCMPLGFVVTDMAGRCLEWNPAAEQIFGYRRDEILQKPVCDFIAPADQRDWIESLQQQAFLTGTTSSNINANFRKDGQRILCEWHNTPLQNAQGQWIGMLAMVQDVTARQEAAERIRESEARFRSLIDSLPFCCWAFDHEGRYTFQNAIDIQQWGNWLGQNQDNVITAAAGNLDVWRDIRARAMQGELVNHEFDYHPANGTTQHFLTVAAPIRASNPSEDDASTRIYGVVGASIDMTERRRAETQLRRYAFYDLLTGLPRRTILLERLADHLQARKLGDAHHFALLHLELIRFKFIKYSLGHRIAEALLLAVAERLKSLVPPHAMLSRTGSVDEFSILLERTAPTAATHFAEYLLQQLALPFEIEGHELFIHASVGIVLSSHCDGQSWQAEEMFQAADTAMHQARQIGVGHYAVFDPLTQVAAVHRLELDRDLRRALTQDELRLHYQPIIDLTNRQLVALEALVRWQSPQRGMVSPGEFIPLAEETGLIVPLGSWVLRQACEQWQRWRDRWGDRIQLTLNVNLSTVQLLQPDLLEQVDQLLAMTGMLPQYLKLEITETSIVQNAQVVLPTLKALKARRIQLSIDDFGTGYSSLTYLHTFPLDTLKIDRAFVLGIGKLSESVEITRTIILLAHTLGLDVVAEGIETVDQLQLLQKLGCDRGQGYLFSPPLPSEEIETILARDCWIL